MDEFITERDILDIISSDKTIVRSRGEPLGLDNEEDFRQLLFSVNDISMALPQKTRIAKKTSIIISGIAFKQFFHEGNKETALGFGIVYANRNGYNLKLESDVIQEKIYDLLQNIIIKFENDPSIFTDMEEFLMHNFVEINV